MFGSKRRGLLGFLRRHPAKSAAIAAVVLKLARSKAGKVIAVSALAGVAGYLLLRHRRRAGLGSLHSRTGNGSGLRAIFHGKFSHL